MKHYYNEFDPRAAAWLRELMADKLIPKGVVDERSIAEVRAGDLHGYVQCHFFAGIGGWAYALRLAGWPEDKPVWTASCPCQPFSQAGKGLGTDDPRHLWPVLRRLVGRCKPPIIFGEQVASAAGRLWLAGVRANMARLGYALGASDLCAASVGAPQIRQRLYWVANRLMGHTNSQQTDTTEPRQSVPCSGLPSSGCMADAESIEHERRGDSRGRRDGLEDNGTTGVGLADANHARPQGRNSGVMPERTEQLPVGSGGSQGFWSDAIWHQCSDGKARRIPRPEPGVLGMVDGFSESLDVSWIESSFPLAQKVQGRVTLLRGYGNAIAPPLAAEFIQAVMEIL